MNRERMEILAATPMEDWPFVLALSTALKPCEHGRMRGIRACEFCDMLERCEKCGGRSIPVDSVARIPGAGELWPRQCQRAPDGSWCAEGHRLRVDEDTYDVRFVCRGALVAPPSAYLNPFFGALA